MTWKIEYSVRLEKDFRKIDNKQLLKIKKYLNKVGALDDPRTVGKPLKSRFKGLWRYRIGDYRAICEIQDKKLIVLIVKIANRKEVYDY
ncbi:RelE/StbE replicon stabilization toxin [uncultured Candidatus Thioglobus sp.]|nr:RelE/StbE replicon stabilization toxin [uncultured Candidatus Thioglobus sp.]